MLAHLLLNQSQAVIQRLAFSWDCRSGEAILDFQAQRPHADECDLTGPPLRNCEFFCFIYIFTVISILLISERRNRNLPFLISRLLGCGCRGPPTVDIYPLPILVDSTRSSR